MYKTHTPSYLIAIFAILLASSPLLAQQLPQINYQGVARKANGSIISNQSISLRLTIRDGGANGASVYAETRQKTTSTFGLFTVVIGSAGATVQTGAMATINWATGNKFLQVELDPLGGNSFIDMGSSQLQSVPYAIYAATAAPSGIAGGDLGGTYPNPTIKKLNGAAISITAPLTGQVLKWDGSAWTPANITLNKTDIGLGNVDNTSDAAKPVSTATQTGLDAKATNTDVALKAPLASPSFSGTVSGVTATMVGLGNVDNTTDLLKPISTATQTGLDAKATNTDVALKAPLASPSFSGTVSGVTATMVGLGNVDNTTDLLKPISTATQMGLDAKATNTDVALKAPLASPSFTGTVSGVTATMVGLGNVNNTTDLLKPISTATQMGLDAKATNTDVALKAPLASPSFSGTVSGVTATMVGLGNVNNTTDLLKPISTATQTGLDAKATNTDVALKAPLASPSFTGTVSGVTATMVGLGNVDNTSDAAKPVSTAVSTALGLKVDKVTGERLINATEITKLGNQSGSNTGDQDLSSLATNTALNTKQAALSGTGIVKSTAGTISYLTDPIPIANGGTGATTASAARTNLGLVIGTNVQAPLTAGTNYLTPTGSAASLTNFPTFNQSTTGNATTASTVTTNANLSGDVTSSSSNATTVVKINGTSLSGLATGILKNTTTTGVPSIAVAADFPTLNQSTTGNAATATTVTTNANLSGDVTSSSSNATTVVKINGTSLSGLATGILKNTTTTGVPSIAVAADFPTLNQSTTGNASTATTATNVSGTVAVANGGTGATTLTANSVLLGNGTSALQVVAPSTSGNVLTSNGTTWTSAAAAGGHTIGESYGGGIVFYVYDDGKHGLIAATADQNGGAGIRWYGGTYTNTRARADGVGAGLKNTVIIIANQGQVDGGAFAATVCNEYSVTVAGVTYGDWYLPSKYEISLLFLKRNVVGGFSSYYWTSSESSSGSAWYQDFVDGGQSYGSTEQGLRVRAVRAF